MFGCRKEDGESLISTRFLAMPEQSTKYYPFKKYFFYFFLYFSAMIFALRLRPLPDWRERSNVINGGMHVCSDPCCPLTQGANNH